MNTNTLSSPFGDFSLQRYPSNVNQGRQQSLRAWDAADEYLLHWLSQHWLSQQPPPDNPDTLILNDSFGALSVSLNRWPIQTQSDSFIALEGCRINLDANNLPKSCTKLLNSLENPATEFDLVVIKVPKTLALLEDQLYRLRSNINNATVIVAAGMSKHIHNSTLQLFEKIIGPTTTSLAQKKARLIFCTPNCKIWQGQSPYPSSYELEDPKLRLWNHANVFSRSGLDIGTRLFLEHFPDLSQAADIIDLGCGNGVLGLMAKIQQPNAKVHFYDESYMAIESAIKNINELFSTTEGTSFTVNNGLQDVVAKSADIVLNNPPFHQQNVVGDHIAWQMFKDARRVLKPGGTLYVIGNRHLGYYTKLQKLFHNCETVASNCKFVLLKSTA